MSYLHMLRSVVASLIALTLLSLSATVNAEAASEDATLRNYGVIEEVISTARKRSEPLQDTPVASTVLGGETLDLLFHTDLKSIAFPAPNVNIATVSAFSNAVSVSIRGISNSDIDSTVDPPVAIFVDGVYVARPVASSMDLFDVEQIEVLRGPQGTLFGRNTSAGALQIRTRRPSGEFEARGKISVGEYGRRDIRAAVDIPLVEGKVNAKVAVMSQNMDGYYTSAINGRDLGAEDILSIRPMIEFTPTDTLDITLIGEYHRNKSEPRPQQNESPAARILCAVHGFCGFPIGDGNEFKVEAVEAGFIDAEIWGLTGELNWELETGILTVVANYRDTDEDVVYDPDAVLYPMFLVDRKQPHSQWSTEVRFASTAWERFDFTVGANIFHQEYDLERNTFLQIIAPPIGRNLSLTGQEHDAYSIFGELNYHVSDALTLTVGARFSDEEKDFYQNPFGPFPNAGARINVSESWSDFGPKFGLQYRFNDNLMSYASYQKGFKSGGFNGRCGQSVTCLRSFDPEEVDGYEVGLKADFLDRRLRANLAVFWSEYSDLQRGAIVPLPPGAANPQETVTDNAAGATIRGIELELTAIIADGFQVNFSAGYLDAEYDDFCADINGAGAFPSAPTSNCGGSVTQTTNLGTPGGAASYLVDEDNSGFDIARAPELNYTINATYNLMLGNGGTVTFNGRYVYVDEMFTSVTAASLREDVGLLDASVSYEDPEGRYRLSLYGKNITNEIYADSRTIVPPLFDTRAVNAPERYGIELSFSL